MDEDTISRATIDRHDMIALILGLHTPFYDTIAHGARLAAEQQRMPLLVDAPAQFDPAEQARIVDDYITRKVAAIIIAPCDGQALIEPLQRAHNEGIKIITVDAFIGDGNYVNGPVTFPLAYIGSDNAKGGRMAGEALLRVMGGRGTVYVQTLQAGVSATDLREQGFAEVIAQSNGAVSIVGMQFDGGSIARAAEQTAAMLRQYPALTGIMSTGDYSSRGVAQALRATNKSQHIKVARFDASQDAINDLRAGIVDVVISQLPTEMGRLAVEYAVLALRDKDSPLKKYVETAFVLIDRDNVITPEAQRAIYIA